MDSLDTYLGAIHDARSFVREREREKERESSRTWYNTITRTFGRETHN